MHVVLSLYHFNVKFFFFFTFLCDLLAVLLQNLFMLTPRGYIFVWLTRTNVAWRQWFTYCLLDHKLNSIQRRALGRKENRSSWRDKENEIYRKRRRTKAKKQKCDREKKTISKEIFHSLTINDGIFASFNLVKAKKINAIFEFQNISSCYSSSVKLPLEFALILCDSFIFGLRMSLEPKWWQMSLFKWHVYKILT